jgi:protein HIRA/HIR1
MIASCSVDNSINVWSIAEKQNIMKYVRCPLANVYYSNGRLEHHKGHVKGISWDPLDRYLLSQGDNECFITSLQDGSAFSIDPEHKLLSALQGSLFLRPSWSPDGSTFILTNCGEFGGNEAVIFTREKWGCVRKLKGHVGNICCAAYSPKLLEVYHIYLSTLPFLLS